MKLTRNLKHLIFLIVCSYFIQFSECFENQNQNQNRYANSNHFLNSNTNLAHNNMANSEKFSLNGGIFMNTKAMKHKKIKTNNLSVSNTDVQVNSNLKNENVNTNNNLNKNTKDNNDYQVITENSELNRQTNIIEKAYEASKSQYHDSSHKKIDLENSGPVLMHAWVKFFKYNDEYPEDQKAKNKMTNSTPKTFLKNHDFREQFKLYPGEDYSSKDKEGEYKFIKNDDYFYLIVYKTSAVLFTSKEENLRKAIDSYIISDMRPVYEDDNKFGGVTDFGEFSEGSCAKIITRTNGKIVWIVCFENGKLKMDFMGIMRSLKIDEQHQDGLIVMRKGEKGHENTIQNLLNPHTPGSHLKSENGDLKVKFNSTQSITDGYWIVLQDWTQCSLKCGGGTSTLQRMCVPPKSGGADCKGEAIITKKCNMHPCPQVYKTNELKTNTTINKPIIKSMMFSNKPQRYIKCKIKETDLMLFQNISDPIFYKNPLIKKQDLQGQSTIQMPVRAIMNNSTFTVYTGESSESLYMSFTLAVSRFIRSTKEGCFEIYENTNKYLTLCPFGCDNNQKAVEEWDYDFNLFKYQCSYKRSIYDDDELKKKLDDKIRDAKNGLLLEQQEKIRVRTQQQEKDNLSVMIKNTNGIALQAIQKEINLEALIQKEEEERIEREKKEIILSIEKEKAKKECVLKAIKERELENQYNIHANQAKQTIENIKRETAQQVLLRRNQLQERIKGIRERAEREKNKLKQQLQTVRYSIADEIGSHYKKGDINKCVMAMENPKRRNDYCVSSFPDDFNDLSYCKTTSDFCTFCCDTEITDLYLPERQDCYAKVCIKGSVPEEDNNGKWVWTENHH